MARVDPRKRQIQAKLVYYGPGLCGKTTNLEYVATTLNNGQEMMSLATEGDRTIFFDFFPLNLGQIRGMETSFKLYTVPGQVRYNQTRKMVLKNVDGIVFVADSQPAMMDANLESLDNLFSNLEELNISPAKVAIVLQYNKRDLPGALAPEVLDRELNQAHYPRFLASAKTGEGVMDTLKQSCKEVIRLLSMTFGEAPKKAPAPAQPVAQSAPRPLTQRGIPVQPTPAPAAARMAAPAPAPAAARMAAPAPAPAPVAARPAAPAPAPAAPRAAMSSGGGGGAAAAVAHASTEPAAAARARVRSTSELSPTPMGPSGLVVPTPASMADLEAALVSLGKEQREALSRFAEKRAVAEASLAADLSRVATAVDALVGQTGLSQIPATLREVASNVASYRTAVSNLDKSVLTRFDRLERAMRDRVTKQQMKQLCDGLDELAKSAGKGGGSDVSGLARRGDVDKLAAKVEDLLRRSFAGGVAPDVSGLASKSDVKALAEKVEALAARAPAGGAAPDVSGLASKQDVKALTEKLEALAKRAPAGGDAPDVSGLASKADVEALTEKLDALAQRGPASGDAPDVSGLASKADVEALTEQIKAVAATVAEAPAPVAGEGVDGDAVAAQLSTLLERATKDLPQRDDVKGLQKSVRGLAKRLEGAGAAERAVEALDERVSGWMADFDARLNVLRDGMLEAIREVVGKAGAGAPEAESVAVAEAEAEAVAEAAAEPEAEAAGEEAAAEAAGEEAAAEAAGEEAAAEAVGEEAAAEAAGEEAAAEAAGEQAAAEAAGEEAAGEEAAGEEAAAEAAGEEAAAEAAGEEAAGEEAAGEEKAGEEEAAEAAGEEESAETAGEEGAEAAGEEGAETAGEEGAEAAGEEGAEAAGDEEAKASGEDDANAEKAAGEEEAKAGGEEDAKADKAAASEEDDAALKKDPRHKNAARVARVMLSDLYLYHRKEVDEGLQEGDFYERNKEALDNMRMTYESRVDEEVRTRKDYLSEAIEKFIERKRKDLGIG